MTSPTPFEFEDLSLEQALEYTKPRVRAGFEQGRLVVIRDYQKAPFQIQDLQELSKKDYSANWSEMLFWALGKPQLPCGCS